MMKLTKWQNKQIMYWGDHVFADLAEPSRQSGWHTGAIVRELDAEINVLKSTEYLHLMKESQIIERQIQKNSSTHVEGLETRRNENFKLRSGLFNPNFGSVFSSRGQSSSFGSNVVKISDLYTSKLSNLLHYEDDYRFYPTRLEHMPHDVDGEEVPPTIK